MPPNRSQEVTEILVNLFVSLFSADGLRIWLHSVLDPMSFHSLPSSSVALRDLAFKAAELLIQRGLLGHGLFASLAAAFPGRTCCIEQATLRCLGEDHGTVACGAIPCFWSHWDNRVPPPRPADQRRTHLWPTVLTGGAVAIGGVLLLSTLSPSNGSPEVTRSTVAHAPVLVPAPDPVSSVTTPVPATTTTSEPVAPVTEHTKPLESPSISTPKFPVLQPRGPSPRKIGTSMGPCSKDIDSWLRAHFDGTRSLGEDPRFLTIQLSVVARKATVLTVTPESDKIYRAEIVNRLGNFLLPTPAARACIASIPVAM